jgi:hypothetical protein
LFKDYELTLRAHNSLGPGEESPPVVFSTSEEGKQNIFEEKRETEISSFIAMRAIHLNIRPEKGGEGQFQKRENLDQGL